MDSVFAYDTETTGTNPYKGDRPFLFTFADASGNTDCIEFPVHPRTRRVRYGKNPKGFKRVKSYLENPRTTKVCHNAKFDLRMSRFAGIHVAGRVEDTLYAAKICNSDLPNYGLKWLCKYLMEWGNEDEDELKKAVRSLRLIAKKTDYKISTDEHSDTPVAADYWLTQYAMELTKYRVAHSSSIRTSKARKEAYTNAKRIRELCITYGTLDAERTIALWLLFKEIMEEEDLLDVYEEEVHKLLPVTMQIEDYGVQIKPHLLYKGFAITGKRTGEAGRTLKEHAPEGFNPNSNPQKVNYFIEELGLRPLSLTKNDNPSIDNVFLEYYQDESPVAGAILKHAKNSKAHSTYFKNYLRNITPGNTLHCTFDQVGTTTLRFACRNPALQTVPKRVSCFCGADIKKVDLKKGLQICKDGHRSPIDSMLLVRACFGPRKDHIWLLNDYAQIEARIFADEAGEETLLEAFENGLDPYQNLADRMNEETGANISRQVSKSIFLGKLYGLGKKKLVQQIASMGHTHIRLEEAENIILSFNDTFPTVAYFMKEVQKQVRMDGYVINRYGQKLIVDKEFAYKGVNYIIQSSAARLMKRAMIKCQKYLVETLEGIGSMVLTIHDELIFELPLWDERLIPICTKLKELMEDNDGLYEDVETPVDADVSTTNWLEKISLADFVEAVDAPF